jgi:hypothetical protein
MVTLAIELVGRTKLRSLAAADSNIAPLFPLSGLGPDVARYVESGDIGHQLGVAAAARPGVLGEARPFEAVDHVVVHAHVVRRRDQQLAQDLDRFRAARRGLLVRCAEALHQVQRKVSPGFHLLGISRDNRAQALDVVAIRVLRFRIPASGDGGDVKLRFGRLARAAPA